MISGAKIYCFSHFMCFYAIIFTYILLIQDAARQCQRCENVVFPLCRCARLSLYFINTGCGSAVSIPSFSGSCMCIPQPSSSRDARSCVSRSACHSFYCQAFARAFLSLMLVRRKILRLYFCLMEFIVKGMCVGITLPVNG